MIEMINKLIQPLSYRVFQMLRRAFVSLVQVPKDSSVQKLQLSYSDEDTQDDVEHVQNFGFASHPIAGSAQAIVLCPGGLREHAIAVAVSDPNHGLEDALDEGESAVYNAYKARIVLRNGGKIEIHNGSEDLIRILNDLIDILSSASVIVPAGNWKPDTQKSLLEIQSKLKKFK